MTVLDSTVPQMHRERKYEGITHTGCIPAVMFRSIFLVDISTQMPILVALGVSRFEL